MPQVEQLQHTAFTAEGKAAVAPAPQAAALQMITAQQCFKQATGSTAQLAAVQAQPYPAAARAGSMQQLSAGRQHPSNDSPIFSQRSSLAPQLTGPQAQQPLAAHMQAPCICQPSGLAHEAQDQGLCLSGSASTGQLHLPDMKPVNAVPDIENRRSRHLRAEQDSLAQTAVKPVSGCHTRSPRQTARLEHGRDIPHAKPMTRRRKKRSSHSELEQAALLASPTRLAPHWSSHALTKHKKLKAESRGTESPAGLAAASAAQGSKPPRFTKALTKLSKSPSKRTGLEAGPYKGANRPRSSLSKHAGAAAAAAAACVAQSQFPGRGTGSQPASQKISDRLSPSPSRHAGPHPALQQWSDRASTSPGQLSRSPWKPSGTVQQSGSPQHASQKVVKPAAASARAEPMMGFGSSATQHEEAVAHDQASGRTSATAKSSRASRALRAALLEAGGKAESGSRAESRGRAESAGRADSYDRVESGSEAECSGQTEWGGRHEQALECGRQDSAKSLLDSDILQLHAVQFPRGKTHFNPPAHCSATIDLHSQKMRQPAASAPPAITARHAASAGHTRHMQQRAQANCTSPIPSLHSKGQAMIQRGAQAGAEDSAYPRRLVELESSLQSLQQLMRSAGDTSSPFSSVTSSSASEACIHDGIRQSSLQGALPGATASQQLSVANIAQLFMQRQRARAAFRVSLSQDVQQG